MNERLPSQAQPRLDRAAKIKAKILLSPQCGNLMQFYSNFLREINCRKSSFEIATFDNFDFTKNAIWSILKGKIVFTEILSGRKILKFPHCTSSWSKSLEKITIMRRGNEEIVKHQFSVFFNLFFVVAGKKKVKRAGAAL